MSTQSLSRSAEVIEVEPDGNASVTAVSLAEAPVHFSVAPRVEEKPSKKTRTVPKGQSKLVQMRLSSQTMGRIMHLKRLTGVRNRTQLVSAAIKLMDVALSEVDDGTKLCLKRSDGSLDYITVVF